MLKKLLKLIGWLAFIYTWLTGWFVVIGIGLGRCCDNRGDSAWKDGQRVGSKMVDEAFDGFKRAFKSNMQVLEKKQL